jgi:hypothetical protein
MRLKILCLVFLIIVFCLKSFDNLKSQDITRDEVEDLGNGLSLYWNIKSNNTDRFAILSPPLSGILTVLSLNLFTDISMENLNFLPSGNYSDMVSYMYAISSSQKIGEGIIQNLSKDEVYKLKIAMRWKNIIGMLVIFCILIFYNQSFLSILLVLIFTLNNSFINSTSQVLCSLFVIVTLELIISTLKSKSKIKFTAWGLFIGLTISSSGFNGLKLNLMTIIAALVYDDFTNKSLNRGFKKDWIMGVLLSCFVCIIMTWITYGLYLAPLEEGLQIFNIESDLSSDILNLKIIPFYDTFKQSIFEIIFREDNYVASFGINLMILLRYSWIFVLVLLFKVKKIQINQYFIALILILFISIISSNQNHEKALIFLQTISIILPILMTLTFFKPNTVKNS